MSSAVGLTCTQHSRTNSIMTLSLSLYYDEIPTKKQNDVTCALGQCYLELGHFEKSKKLAKFVLKYNNQSIDAIAIKAQSFFHTCDFEHAMVLFYKGQRLAPAQSGLQHGILQCKKTIQCALDTEIFNTPGIANYLDTLSKSIKRTEDEVSDETERNEVRKPVRKFNKARKKNKQEEKKKESDRLQDDKIFLHNLSANIADNSSDRLGQYLSQSAMSTLMFLDDRKKFWEQVEKK